MKERDGDARISEDDTRTTGVLNREFGLAVLACDTPDCAREVVPVKGFDVFDFERVEVEVVHAQEGDRIVYVKPEREGFDEVGALLQCTDFFRVPGRLQVHQLLLFILKKKRGKRRENAPASRHTASARSCAPGGPGAP